MQSAAYNADWSRAMADVDVLVPEHDYARARRALRTAGCSWHDNGPDEAYVHVPGHALAVDVHRRLLPRATFALRTADVFARSRRDEALFGTELWLPDPLDVYAHLVGHFLMSRSGPADHQRLSDFVTVSRAADLDPVRCARHLEQVGLSRAARYVLPLVAEQHGDPFSARVLHALRRDAVGDVLAYAVRRALPCVPKDVRLGALGTHLLGRSLPAGAWGLAGRVAAHWP